MRGSWNTIFTQRAQPEKSALQSLLGLPVYEISDPADQNGYATSNAVYFPRWAYLLQFNAAGNHFKALELLEQRTNDVLDRRLKEINL